jgi:hypothetical protein
MRTICLALLLFLAYASDNVEVANIDPGSADCDDSDSGTISEPYQCSGTDYSYKQIVHLTSKALIVAVQDSCRCSFRLVRANLKCDPIDAEF